MVPGITYLFVQNYMEQCLKIYIRNTRTDRYNLMCSIYVHDKQQPLFFDVGSSGGGNAITLN